VWIGRFYYICFIRYSYGMTIEDIAMLCEARSVRWTSHILQRIFRRGISMDDVISALTNGEIIEQYPSDYPFPSCLVLGRTQEGKTLHVVCGSSASELWLVTAYIPSPAEWTEDFRQRRQV
jgi:hypothetical protein